MGKMGKVIAGIVAGVAGLSLVSCGTQQADDKQNVNQETPIVSVDQSKFSDKTLKSNLNNLAKFTANFKGTNAKDRNEFEKQVGEAKNYASQLRLENKLTDLKYNEYLDELDKVKVVWVETNVKDAVNNSFDHDAITLSQESDYDSFKTALSKKDNAVYSVKDDQILWYVDQNYTYSPSVGVSSTSQDYNPSTELNNNFTELVDFVFSGTDLRVNTVKTAIGTTYYVMGTHEGEDGKKSAYSMQFNIENDDLTKIVAISTNDKGSQSIINFTISEADYNKFVEKFGYASKEINKLVLQSQSQQENNEN